MEIVLFFLELVDVCLEIFLVGDVDLLVEGSLGFGFDFCF